MKHRSLCCLLLMALCAPATFATEGQSAGFDGGRAYEYLRAICAFGNRRSGSPGMERQQELLEKHFKDLEVPVEYQRFEAKHPLTGETVPMANMIMRWFPERKERILLCAHYDTRPLPDMDIDPRRRREGLFVGANDGASGVAVLMELANQMHTLTDRYGVDMVLFDAEELVYGRRGKYFLGSTHFARKYAQGKRDYQYVAGVLLDMVGDADLTIFQEQHSVAWDETRPLVHEIWSTAARLGVHEFIPRVGYAVQDDHLPLYHIGKIPVIDVIDFHYPDARNSYWHTTQDQPGRCSAESLGKVGRVMLEWLRTTDPNSWGD